MNSNALMWIWLKVCVNDKNLEAYRLYKHFGNIEKIYSLTTDEISQLDFINDDSKISLNNKELRTAEAIKRSCEANNVEIITIDDKRYPESLLEINNPPCILFARGNVEKAFSKPLITMVGTRDCNSYGERSASRISAVAAYAGFTVVTGVAKGIDTSVINGALGVGGSVIAILPGGHGTINFGESYKFKDVFKDGVILSEHLPTFRSHKFLYQERNRILAGISIASVIIQAPIKSGALMTANYALEQNKDVFALPADIDMAHSVGCNKLIGDGATPIINYKTIVDYYAPKLNGQINDDIPEHLLTIPSISESNEEEKHEFKKIAIAHLDEIEQVVFYSLQSGQKDANMIMEQTQLPITSVVCALSSLVAMEIIEPCPGNKYKIIR